jgi:hypothetical protein
VAVNPVGARPSGHADGTALGDAVDGAFAVLAVAAALVRYAAETTVRSRRAVLPRRPFPRRCAPAPTSPAASGGRISTGPGGGGAR